MIAKAGLGLIGLGAISIGGVAVTKPHLLGMDYMPNCNHLGKDNETSGSYNNKFGGKHKYYLAGTKNDNKSWWEWSFRRLKKEKGTSADGKFKFITTGSDGVKSEFSDSDTTALNQVCKAAYKSETSNITSAGGDSNYKESDVWRYCSWLGEKPKTISENSETGNYTENNAIGADESESKKLVSTKGNNKFWEIREKEFRGKPGYEKIEGNDSEDLFFHPTNKKESIRQLCEIAYNKSKETSSSSATAPAKEKTIKYCSLSKE